MKACRRKCRRSIKSPGKQEILEAARRVFIRKGYQAATMKDVVEESGLSRGGVYMYYGSTEEMMLALVEQIDRSNETDYDRAIGADGSVWGAIERLMDQTQQEAETVTDSLVPALIEFFINAWRSRKYDALMEERYRRGAQILEAFLQNGVDRGEFRPIVPVGAVVLMLLSFYDGLMVQAVQLGPEAAQTRVGLDTMLEALRHLLQVQDGNKEVSP
ncbi:TetR family transcriptional regulator [Paenibacillus sp. P25]|nr:TetR family transcriptional regulator [Paenibacillus sp. P25]